MTEFISEDSKEIYAIHKGAAENLASTEAEVKEAGQALAEAQVNNRQNWNAKSRQAAKEAAQRFKKAGEAHVEAHQDYPNSIAEGREYYDDNEAALNEQAVKDAKAAGVETSFGTSSKG